MPIDPGATEAVLKQIDRNELAQLGCDLASIPSPTGQEKAIAEFILKWFGANGIKPVRQDVEFDRPNAVGLIKGDGTGLSLGFNGHTDTSFTGTEEDRRMVAVMEPESELQGKIVGDKATGTVVNTIASRARVFRFGAASRLPSATSRRSERRPSSEITTTSGMRARASWRKRSCRERKPRRGSAGRSANERE